MSVDERGLVLGAGEGRPERWVDESRGDVAFHTLFSRERTSTAVMTNGVGELAPGASFHVHRHTPPEVYYLLEGEGVITLDDHEHPVATGSSVFIPSRVWHGLRNTGTGLLRFYYVLGADAIGDVDYDFPAPRRTEGPDRSVPGDR